MAIVERRLETARSDIEAWRVAHPGVSWSEWVIDEATTGNWLDELGLGPLSPEAIRLLELVHSVIEPTVELTRYLSQLEPKGADEALKEADGVRLMTISKSKGLTFDTVFVVGVEHEQMPFRDANVNEERRLLYVALTRARTQCYATMATKRTPPTARIGIGDSWHKRSRCPLLDGVAGAHLEDGEAYLRRNFGP
jgi:DNA helicase-2/ATP-dependent DNA helicase PcrA